MPTTMNDYERRFQRSLQKLTIPTWYAETIPSSKSKQSIVSSTSTTTTQPTISWKNECRDSSRTPEIIHIRRRPHSYRSCRSSLATSPSPSIHSWHPNHMFDGMNFSLAIPSSSSSSSRRQNKYQKGIERVSKSSRWYRPTSFATNESNKDQTGKRKHSKLVDENCVCLFFNFEKEYPSYTYVDFLVLSINRSLIVIVALYVMAMKRSINHSIFSKLPYLLT